MKLAHWIKNFQLLIGINSIQSILHRTKKTRQYLKISRRAAAKICHIAAKVVGPYNKLLNLTKGTLFQRHHVFQDSEMLKMYAHLGYSKGLGFCVPLLGGSRLIGSPHYAANISQMKNRGEALDEVAKKALDAAGCDRKDVDEIIEAAQNYNRLMGWI